MRQWDLDAVDGGVRSALQILRRIEPDEFGAFDEGVEDRGRFFGAATRLRAVVVLAADDDSAQRARAVRTVQGLKIDRIF